MERNYSVLEALILVLQGDIFFEACIVSLGRLNVNDITFIYIYI